MHTKQYSIGKWVYISLSKQKSLPPLAGRWPLTQPNYPFSPVGKSCALAPLNIIPKFLKEKHQFLLDLSSKSRTFICFLCMISKRYQVFFESFKKKTNGGRVCISLNITVFIGAAKMSPDMQFDMWMLALSTFIIRLIIYLTGCAAPHLLRLLHLLKSYGLCSVFTYDERKWDIF